LILRNCYDGAGRRHDQHPQREEPGTGRDSWAPKNAAWCRSNSFSEFKKAEGGDIWFALDEARPLACFAGIWTNWTSVRKVKEGETTNDLFAFLTTERTSTSAPSTQRRPVIMTTLRPPASLVARPPPA
jgi:putative SOS response-associated peptidase YedK